MSARWTAGILIGLPIGAAVFVGLLFASTWLFLYRPARDNYGMMSGWRIASWVCAAGSLVTWLILAIALFPWSAQYHRYVPKHGTVAAVSSRFVGGDSHTSQKFVVRMTDGQQFGCNDTRCSLIQRGDVVFLSCIRAWQWTGIPGWDCNYVRDESPAAPAG